MRLAVNVDIHAVSKRRQGNWEYTKIFQDYNQAEEYIKWWWENILEYDLEYLMLDITYPTSEEAAVRFPGYSDLSYVAYGDKADFIFREME